MKEERKGLPQPARKPRKRPRREKPVTLAAVDHFLDSPVARRYYAFSDSNVKRQVIRMLLFLREEVDRRGPQQETGPEQEGTEKKWVKRVGSYAGTR